MGAAADRHTDCRPISVKVIDDPLELGDDLEGMVAYDERLVVAARHLSIEVVSRAG